MIWPFKKHKETNIESIEIGDYIIFKPEYEDSLKSYFRYGKRKVTNVVSNSLDYTGGKFIFVNEKDAFYINAVKKV